MMAPPSSNSGCDSTAGRRSDSVWVMIVTRAMATKITYGTTPVNGIVEGVVVAVQPSLRRTSTTTRAADRR